MAVALGGRATGGWCLFGGTRSGLGWLRYPGLVPRRLASLIDLAGPSGPALSALKGNQGTLYGDARIFLDDPLTSPRLRPFLSGVVAKHPVKRTTRPVEACFRPETIQRSFRP
jgi:hypothetical protein